jgi:hypothetical protein
MWPRRGYFGIQRPRSLAERYGDKGERLELTGCGDASIGYSIGNRE